jgi:antitoxin component HigA of HigAB toxin-antitoxin module
MSQRGLRPSNLLPIFGSRRVASDVLSGKREPSKAHVRKLAESSMYRRIYFCEDGGAE